MKEFSELTFLRNYEQIWLIFPETVPPSLNGSKVIRDRASDGSIWDEKRSSDPSSDPEIDANSFASDLTSDLGWSVKGTFSV